jgi:DNA invertase Pin-like site-specific DNA recombinase
LTRASASAAVAATITRRPFAFNSLLIAVRTGTSSSIIRSLPRNAWLSQDGLDAADGQTLRAQDAALHAAGCAKVFAEKASGAKMDRAELRKVIKRLDEGDVLIVTRLDRLARSTRDLLNVMHEIAERGAGFKSLADAWCDTTTPHCRLMLTVLGGLAEFERELITRTSEGRERAKANGVHMGRPSKLTPFQRDEAIRRREAGDTLVDIGRMFGVSHTTISRL